MLFIFSIFADELFIKKDYFRALTEYKRELFLGKDTLNSMRMIAECYKKIGDYDKALYWYGRLNFIDNSYLNDYKYLLGITLNIEDLKLTLEEDEVFLKKIIEAYEKTSKKIYLSYFIPGSSQIIFGKYREGIFSFIWNSLSFYLLISRIKEKDYIGSIFALQLFIRFYFGNIEMTRKIEREKSYMKFIKELNNYFSY